MFQLELHNILLNGVFRLVKLESIIGGTEITFDNIKLVCAPASVSGRSMTDRDCSLWCSWLILGQRLKFSLVAIAVMPLTLKIGDKYGPFDLTLMECGQYDPRWSAIHMLPEETVQAHIDVQENYFFGFIGVLYISITRME